MNLFKPRRRPSNNDSTLIDPAHQQATLNGLIAALLRDRKSDRRSRTLRVFLYFLIFGGPTLFWVSAIGLSGSGWFGPSSYVAVVHLDGEISPGSLASGDRVIPALTKAFEDSRVKAIALSIDSPGGAPLESESIYRAFSALQKKHPKPVIAVIKNIGASAAYMVALHTDRIYAGRYSLVGSIGAVLSGWDVHKALERYDVSQRVFASGDLKAMLNPYLPMSPEAESKAHDLVNRMGHQFAAELVQARHAQLKPGIDYGSGEVWGGAQAVDIGLVDELGTLDEVIRTRWNLPVKDFGPNGAGIPFLSSSAQWLANVIGLASQVPTPSATPALR